MDFSVFNNELFTKMQVDFSILSNSPMNYFRKIRGDFSVFNISRMNYFRKIRVDFSITKRAHTPTPGIQRTLIIKGTVEEDIVGFLS